jgi:hypothetical protein
MLALVVATLLAASTAWAWATGQPTLTVGAAAPETVLPDQRGQSVHLADLLKQRDFVVVAFYVKAFTGG